MAGDLDLAGFARRSPLSPPAGEKMRVRSPVYDGGGPRNSDMTYSGFFVASFKNLFYSFFRLLSDSIDV